MNEPDRLFPKIKQYLDDQSVKLVRVAEAHQAALYELSRWIARREKKPSDIIMVCTGNSRRSILGATMGNIVAAYRNKNHLRFHSAGTAPSAFNSRTIATLKEIGLVIEATGSQAKVGAKKEANPHYRIEWGKGANTSVVEYSKLLDDVALPGRDFAAVMVCDDADAKCPTVAGADLRVSMTFLDPKAFDGTKEESAEYGKTRDLLAQTMLRIIK
ncbi:MAG TPA: hypothetical protein PLN21_07515 [Gemmatales bacterium]|nr:hypothetical protein [Gemmatales bacterium]